MFRTTSAIYDALKKKGDLKFFTEENPESSEVWLQFGIKNGGSYRIRFISKSDDNDVAVRVFSLVSVDKEQVAKVLPILNDLNTKYRFLKFVCDHDGDINVEYDFPQSCISPEESAVEIIIRFVQIVDEAYPQIMRALWN